MMKVVFRVDASVWIGSGHVMRCLVLADELAKNGHDVTFACLPLEGDMRAFIGERGFNVITLTAPDHVVKPAHDADYVAWLPKPIPDDAHDFINHVHDADVVVTDHYAIEKQWHEIVRARLTATLSPLMILCAPIARTSLLIKPWGVKHQIIRHRALTCSQAAIMHYCRARFPDKENVRYLEHWRVMFLASLSQWVALMPLMPR
jgi:Spore coat polysaccharide biosynthesis protein, predicted glycosyltransferase